MTMMITFKVDADPVGKQRARYAKRGNLSKLTPLTKQETMSL